MAERPALDLTVFDFKRQSRELTVFGTWIEDEEEEDDEPCLVITETRKIGSDKLIPCAVLLSEAWRYDDPANGHLHLLSVAMRFVKAMGLTDNMTNAHMIADAIHGHLLDLIKIPPKPRGVNRNSGAEATIVDPNGKRISIEMYDNE